MRRIFSAVLVVGIVALFPTLSISAVRAGPPAAVEGSFDYTFNVTDVREADGNRFVYAAEDEVWIGAFQGTSKAVFRVEMFSSGFWNVWLRSSFTGTVMDESGTMVIQLVGRRPESGYWQGQWVILSGTGDLANLRGEGTWGGPGFGAVGPDISYSGQIHFEAG